MSLGYNMKEKWKKLSNISEHHLISNMDRIFIESHFKIIKNQHGSVKILTKPKLLNPCKDSRGYFQVSLNTKLFLVHRLVAEAFLKPPSSYLLEEAQKTVNKKVLVNHIDKNKTNNNVNNLEWCTYKQNTLHSKDDKVIPKGSDVYSAVLTEKQVLEILDLSVNSKLSQVKIAEMYGVKQITVSNIKTGKSWTHLTGITNTRKNLSNNNHRLCFFNN